MIKYIAIVCIGLLARIFFSQVRDARPRGVCLTTVLQMRQRVRAVCLVCGRRERRGGWVPGATVFDGLRRAPGVCMQGVPRGYFENPPGRRVTPI